MCVCVQLLVAADQLLLEQMKRKCEKVLSEKINAEVAVPMYQAAYHYSAPQLLACSSHYLLLHYKEIRDQLMTHTHAQSYKARGTFVYSLAEPHPRVQACTRGCVSTRLALLQLLYTE